MLLQEATVLPILRPDLFMVGGDRVSYMHSLCTSVAGGDRVSYRHSLCTSVAGGDRVACRHSLWMQVRGSSLSSVL